jgi:UDP-N-acetylmuramoyl-L-alanyl-D-glutamate--2,6-diaminopimelate ligase
MKSIIRKIKNAGHIIQAVGSATYHKFPSKNLIVIGVTGTDGKTTTANLIYHILRADGKKVAVISTIGAIINDVNYDTGFHVTTPSSFEIQKYLKIAKKQGCTHIVLEVTSHALDQNRVWGVKFQIGVLTNITHEHLDYHKSYETYVKAKLRLLERSEVAIVNSNGEWFAQIKKAIPDKKMISYSLHGVDENDLSLTTMPFQIQTKLIGDFNLENIIAATAVAKVLGIDTQVIDAAIQNFDAPKGRQEWVGQNGVKVMVDFAHTANSFENILPEVRKRITGRLIHVFGAAGLRDHGKRPEMGKVASFFDDIIILTAEDPRSEEISEINRQIKDGISNEFLDLTRQNEASGKAVYEIENRKEAIDFAISLAGKNDTVIITGKGHELSIDYGSGEEKWSDQEAVRDIFKGINNEQ